MSVEFTIALSYSRISDYRQCPLKFKLKYLNKDPMFKEDESKSPHLVRGSNVHKALENYIVKKTSGQTIINPGSLPEVESTKPLIDKFVASYETVIPESQIAVNSDWQRVEWFDRSAYMRAIFDFIAIRPSDIVIGDFKTGKLRDYEGTDEKPGQLHLSAAIALQMWPTVPQIHTMYLYVDHKTPIVKTFTQNDREPLVKKFTEEHAAINADKEFKPTVNEFCKWCPATRSVCPFSRKI